MHGLHINLVFAYLPAVATLTYQIRQLTEHFNGNRKHYGAMR